MHGCTRANPDVNREGGMEKRERKKMGVDDKGGAWCDEVCRNILQPKPINKRRGLAVELKHIHHDIGYASSRFHTF